MKIIGITGRARSGKDTLAGILLKLQTSSTQLSFAGPLREFVAKLIGVPVKDLLDGPFKEAPLPHFNGVSPRQMMQTLGTEWGRHLVDPDLWIKAAAVQIELCRKADMSLVVFSDIRFENEASMIRDLGGTVVHLKRPSLAPVACHISEAGIMERDNDYFIQNNGGLETLGRAAEFLLQSPR